MSSSTQRARNRQILRRVKVRHDITTAGLVVALGAEELGVSEVKLKRACRVNGPGSILPPLLLMRAYAFMEPGWEPEADVRMAEAQLNHHDNRGGKR